MRFLRSHLACPALHCCDKPTDQYKDTRHQIVHIIHHTYQVYDLGRERRAAVLQCSAHGALSSEPAFWDSRLGASGFISQIWSVIPRCLERDMP